MNSRGWTETASAQWLADSRRLRIRHGPIDLIVEAFGAPDEVSKAYVQAQAAFADVLPTLVDELPRLRAASGPGPKGPVARLMWSATRGFAPEFITPMAAVAGSVADYILQGMIDGRSLARAYVNNSGDIALHMREGRFTVAICEDPVSRMTGGKILLAAEDGIGGIATSGWRGRSHSLGIADAVTVLARTAARADAAATMIANKVDLPGSAKISRVAARKLAPDSDLGDLLVTTAVAPLAPEEIAAALLDGEKAARAYLGKGLIDAAYVALAGERRVIADTHDAAPRLRQAIGV